MLAEPASAQIKFFTDKTLNAQHAQICGLDLAVHFHSLKNVLVDKSRTDVGYFDGTVHTHTTED